MVLAGGRTVREFQAFIAAGEPLAARNPQMAAAVEDARRRIEAVQTRMRGG
jgi:hypothetical protein